MARKRPKRRRDLRGGERGRRRTRQASRRRDILGTITQRQKQRGSGFDLQKLLGKTGIEFHWPGYQYMGPGTRLAERLKRGDPGINRLDRIAKQHDIDYSRAKNLRDKWKADESMVKAIEHLPGRHTMTERIVKRIMQAKKTLKL